MSRLSIATPRQTLADRLRKAWGMPDGQLRLRNPRSTAGILLLFVLASLPAALVGAWSAGTDWLADPASGEGAGWRYPLLKSIGFAMTPADTASAIAAGLGFLVPLFLVAVMTSIAWELLFASARRRAVDPGWLMSSWLFVLLLPAQTPLVFAAVGMSFGAVIGKHVFGGTGRYIASPAAVGALFLHFAYPALASATTTWGEIAILRGSGAMETGLAFLPVFAGRETGLIGTTSALACLAGAAWLALAGAASWRTLAGGLLGIAAAGLLAAGLGSSLPPHWHFALGNAAFCWAFVLTDPTTLPLTRSGRWLHGLSFGGLLVLMREADPTHPESSLFAVMLAALLVPLIDYATVRAGRRHNALELPR